ncbi:MAG: hypothetical protein EXR07_01000 [Acetobacteraceae bacterium]|nr:hypothetical protein [Acetobacteraceae bacterium]
MWAVATRSGQWPVLSRLIPKRVMAEYDGPCLFTTFSDDGFLFLAYLCAQESGYERFLLVPASDRLVDAIEANQITLAEALTQTGWGWLVDQRPDGSITNLGAIDPRDLPDSAMPKPGNYLVVVAEPFLRLRLEGESLTSHHVPASVVKRALDGATGAVRALMGHVLLRSSAQGRPVDWFRRFYDLPARGFALGSFEVVFDRPPAAGQLTFDDDKAIEDITRLLSKGLDWATDPIISDLPTDAESSAIVNALAQLAPTLKGTVSSVEVSGVLAGNPRPHVRLSRETSERISQAKRRLPADVSVRTFEGLVREFDKDRLSFILRSADGANLGNVAFTEGQHDDALFAFETDRSVTIVVTEPLGGRISELLSLAFTASPATSSPGVPDR